ncbi:MAG: FAD binding domain-containing protein, partial [Rhodobacteraceae bacterium]|nr:FAD binding domain-containing protein [Paracoccaceae bacterium]
MYNFEFARPETLADAITALAEDGAEPLAGGQTLIPSMKARLASPDTIVSLAGLPDMAQITSDSDRITIGAMATHNDVAQGAGAFPALAALAGQIGDPAVRSRGTIGGSIANNDPAACYPAAALGSNAVIITNTRRIEAQDFFLGMFETDLEEGELIISVEFPLPKRALYIKFPQPASRFAMTGVFVAEYGDNDIRVAVTGA